MKQNFQLQYDNVPAELPVSVDLNEIENKLKEVVECVSMINVVRQEFKMAKAKIKDLIEFFLWNNC